MKYPNFSRYLQDCMIETLPPSDQQQIDYLKYIN